VVSEEQLPLAQRFARLGDDFDGVDWAANSEDVPAIAGCLARFDCRRQACHDAGDHTIVVGEVLQVTARAGKGLLFKRGQYGGFLERS
jgi:flavin reductase (DIM6/NTAB) family NADH-FMN oxidoreductase RutF